MAGPAAHEPSAPDAAPESRAGRRAFLTAGASSLALPLTALASAPLLAQTLGAAGRGEMTAALAPPLLGVTLLTLGLPDALTYFTARRHAPEAYTRPTVAVTVGVGALAAIAIWLIAPVLLRNFPEQIPLLRLIATTIPLALLAGVGRGLAQGQERFSLVNVERWLAPTLRLAALVSCAALGLLTVPVAVWLTWGMNLFSAACYAMPLWRTLVVRSASRASFAPFAKYSVLVWAGSVTGLLVMRVDQVLLAAFTGAVPLGWYAAAVSMGEVPLGITAALRPLLLARGAKETHALSAARLCRFAVAACSAMAAVGCLLAPYVVPPVFGHDFGGAVPATQILLAATVPASVSLFAGTGLSALGRPGGVITAQILSLVVALAGLPLLASAYGATGAALASLTAYLVGATYAVWRLHSLSGIPLATLLVIGREDLALLKLRR